MDSFTVVEDRRNSTQRGPVSGRALEEGNVDMWLYFELVDFSGLGVCVKDEVDAVLLIKCLFRICLTQNHVGKYHIPVLPKPCND